jgi:hypothetical protein
MSTYLSVCIFFLAIWTFFFIYKKNKEEQIAVSVFGLLTVPFFMSIVSKYIFTWSYTCPNCWIKFEDLLFGFAISGIASVSFNDFKLKKQSNPVYDKHLIKYCLLSIILSLSLSFALYWVWNINALLSISVGTFVYTIFVASKRKDLLPSIIFSGIFLSVLSIIIFEILKLSNPISFSEIWNVTRISGIEILNSPVESLALFFLFGVFFSSLWEMTFKVFFIHK